jgi:DNA-binding NarL/FixJ family response regulator
VSVHRLQQLDDPPVEDGLEEITAEEREILGLLAVAVPMDAVARRMHLSERSVRRRVRVLCDRIGVAAPIEAVVWAVRRGYL